MIKAVNLTKYFGQVRALENASFSVGKNEIVGFLGPNGAGKSTAMRILTGFFPASRGEAYIDGIEIHEKPVEAKQKIGYLPEHVPLYEDMTVASFLHFVAGIKTIPRNRRKEEVGRVLRHCGLAHMTKRLLRNLSKGYRQRVGLAQALLGNPPILVLDEPTVGLDPTQIVEIRQMIKELKHGHTILLSTHILAEVTMVCDRAIIINAGKIVADKSMEEFTSAGSRSLEEAFIAAVASEADVGEGVS